MNFFGKKELKIIELFQEHLDCVEQTILKMLELLRSVKEGEDRVIPLTNEVREHETQADEKRREMEAEMYLGAFLPNFRGDLLGIVESMDKIANRAEDVANVIELQNLHVPDFLIEDVIELADLSYQTFQAAKQTAILLFEDLDKANETIIQVGEIEHKNDEKERDLVRKIFSSNLELAHKRQMKELVEKIANIADRSENATDRIQIVIFKRRV
jgi:hypothetical protein